MQYIGDEPHSYFLAVVVMDMILVFVARHSLVVFWQVFMQLTSPYWACGLYELTPFLLLNIMMGNSLVRSREKKTIYIEIRRGESTYCCLKTCGC
jgi:hypothetical protein